MGDSEGTTDTDERTDVKKKSTQQRVNRLESAKGYTRVYSGKTTKPQKGK
jgi:hypothetical protein